MLMLFFPPPPHTLPSVITMSKRARETDGEPTTATEADAKRARSEQTDTDMPLLPELWFYLVGAYLSFAEQRTIMPRLSRRFARLFEAAVDQGTFPILSDTHCRLLLRLDRMVETLDTLYPTRQLRCVEFMSGLHHDDDGWHYCAYDFFKFVGWLNIAHGKTIESLHIREPVCSLPVDSHKYIARWVWPKLSHLKLTMDTTFRFYLFATQLPVLTNVSIVGARFTRRYDDDDHDDEYRFMCDSTVREITIDWRPVRAPTQKNDELELAWETGRTLDQIKAFGKAPSIKVYGAPAFYNNVMVEDFFRACEETLSDSTELYWEHVDGTIVDLVELRRALKETPRGAAFHRRVGEDETRDIAVD